MERRGSNRFCETDRWYPFPCDGMVSQDEKLKERPAKTGQACLLPVLGHFTSESTSHLGLNCGTWGQLGASTSLSN